MTALIVWSVVIAIGFVLVALCMEFEMPRLEQDHSPAPDAWPKLSILVPIRNEERNLESALRTLVTATYPNREIIAVDDRSTDRSPEILSKLQKEYPEIRLVRIDALPEGWLGKNNALQTGLSIATGELVLFTDADVIFKAGALEKGVSMFMQGNWDHMAALVRIESPSRATQCLISFFGIMFVFFIHPWRVKSPESGAYLGIGAFNLFRKKVLDEIDGLTAVRLRPDDDIKLGKYVKRKGYRQVAISATEHVSVEWYASVREIVNGLEKNMFAGCDYSLAFTLSGVLGLIAVHVAPTITPFLTVGTHQLIATVAAIVIYGCVLRLTALQKAKPWTALFYTPSALVVSAIFLRTALLNLSRGGIQWRDTFYKLEDLKKNKV